MTDEAAESPMPPHARGKKFRSFIAENSAGGGAIAVLGVGRILVADLALAVVVAFGVVAIFHTVGYRDMQNDGKWAVVACVAFGFGLVPLLWTAYAIGRPHVNECSAGRRVYIPFTYCSTHPSYALIDLLWIPVFIAGYHGSAPRQVWSDAEIRAERMALQTAHVMAIAGIVTLVLVAVVRLVFWYVFRRRLDAATAGRAWQPVTLLLGIAGLIALLVRSVR